MALLFVDGFDFWASGNVTASNTGPWQSVLYSSGASIAAPVISGSKLYFAYSQYDFGAYNYLRKTLDIDAQTTIFNIRMSFGTGFGGSNQGFLYLHDDNLGQIGFIMTATGRIQVRKGTNPKDDTYGTVVATSDVDKAVTLGLETYHDIEIKTTIADVGSIEIRVNGLTVLSISGVDLTGTANESINNFYIGRFDTRGAQSYDHVIVMDATGTYANDFIGPVKVNPHVVTADGFYTDFVANTGTRWDAVNDATSPDGDTTYISANTVGSKYTAVISDLPAGDTNVHGLAVWTNSKRDESETRAYKTLLRESSTDQLSVENKYLGHNYMYQISTFSQSPFTSGQWTTSEINNLEVGVQITV